MNLEQALDLLRQSRSWSVEENLLHIAEINDAAKVFWDSKPTEDEFHHVMNRIILTPRILYYLVTRPL